MDKQKIRQKKSTPRLSTVDDFWRLTGVDAETRRAYVAHTSKKLHGLLRARQPGTHGYRENYAQINLWVVRNLQACQALNCSPPNELINLIAHQLQVGKRPRTDPVDRGKKADAARYLALNPSASRREIARAARVSHNSVTKWLNDPKFSKMAQNYRNLPTSLERQSATTHSRKKQKGSRRPRRGT